MIHLDACKHGWTYKIHSRNLIAGVFNKETNGFVGLREKFGKVFLFTEFHYDTGAPYGTVSPEKEIEECPITDLRESFDTICFKCKGRVDFIRSTPNKNGPGEWQHVETPDSCPKIVTGLGNWGSPKNTALFDYLTELEGRWKPCAECGSRDPVIWCATCGNGPAR